MNFFSQYLLTFTSLLFFTSCLHSEPKVLGNGGLSLAPPSTTNTSNFTFDYAYRDTSSDAGGNIGGNGVVFIKGVTGSNSSILSACNTSGTGCTCDFYASGASTASGSSVGGLTPGIFYYANGNMIICKIPASITLAANAAQVVVRNSSSTISSGKLTTISTASVTLSNILGDLSAANLRAVSNYSCLVNYIQNTGVITTPFSFTCTAGALNFLQLRYKYYLFSDSRSNNYSSRISDSLYNGGMPMCGIPVKQIDCTASTPTKDFGLYTTNTENFTQPVNLAPNPTLASSGYGYAAETITTNATISATALCPPGLLMKNVYSTPITSPTFPVGSACQLGGGCTGTACTNVAAGLQNYIVDNTIAPALTVAPINKISSSGGTDGTCTLNIATGVTTCIAPIGASVSCDAVTNTYSTAGTSFCVIPSSYLP